GSPNGASTSGPLPLARGGLGWGSPNQASTSGPLPLARGGLGWGSPNGAIASLRVRDGAVSGAIP
ncbi:hypothetical protein, partial [Oscillatoria sp. HE19RPO]|uniref:hypothetical protein n=1 Tax=Oscillatoria sp. HE19RPO TaxID=2954806 RepID=UPI0020C31205